MMHSGWSNLRIVSNLHRLNWSDCVAKIEFMAEAFGIEVDALAKPAWTLSGGQMNRLNLIKTLMVPADLYVLDEPTSGVGVAGRHNILRYIQDIAGRTQATVVWTSHSIEELEANCVDILLFSGNNATKCLPVEEAVQNFGFPQLKIVAFRAMNSDDARIVSEQLGCEFVPLCRALLSSSRWDEPPPNLPWDSKEFAHLEIRSVSLVQPSLESAYFGFTESAGKEVN